MKVVAVIFIIIFALSATASDLQVFAAASLSDALKEIAIQYQQRHGIQVEYNSTVVGSAGYGCPE